MNRPLYYLLLSTLAALPAYAASPVAFSDTLICPQNGSLVDVDYLQSNDTDADGDALTVTNVGGAANGTTQLIDGKVTYTPNASYTGDDTFTYTISDGSTTDIGNVHVSVNAALDMETTRDALLVTRPVSSLANPAGNGTMTTWSPTACVVSSYSNADLDNPMIIAATMGAGRIVALPDHQWFEMDNLLDDESTANFYRNAIEWGAGTTSKTIQVVTYDANCATFLAAEGYTNHTDAGSGTLASALAGADVLITWPGSNASQATQDTIEAFVKGGGALLIQEYGAGYSLWWNKETQDIPSNRMLRDAGIAFTKNGTGYARTVLRPTQRVTDDDIHAFLINPTSFSAGDQAILVSMYEQVTQALPETDVAKTRMISSFWPLVAGITPRPNTPITDTTEKSLLAIEGRLLQNVPVADTVAHRAALPVTAPEVFNQVVTLAAPGISHANLVIDTGLYVLPGQVVNLTIPTELVNKVKAQISHLRSDTTDDTFYTMPSQVFTFSLDATSMQIANPYGGLLMFTIDSDVNWTGSPTITVGNGVALAPYFVLGQDTDASWVGGIRDRGTPFGVLDCGAASLVVESDSLKVGENNNWLRTLNSPETTMTAWNNIIGAITEFFNYTGKQLRAHHEYFAYAGLSTNPQYFSTSSNITDERQMTVMGHALSLHEYGHIADHNNHIFYEFSEASPNLGGKYAQQVLSNHFTWKESTPQGRINDYLKTTSLALWDNYNHYAVDKKVVPFEQIANTFGWESLKAIVWAISNKSELNNSQDKLDAWLIEIANETGYDVSDFLNLWQLNFSSEAEAAVSGYPKWSMVETFARNLSVSENGVLLLANPTLNDFSFDGAVTFTDWGVSGDATNGIDPAHGTITLDSTSGTWNYTPTPGYSGPDTFTYSCINATGNVFTQTYTVAVVSSGNAATMEIGATTAGTEGWTTVNLTESYTSPVIIAQIVSNLGGEPLVTRITNVTGTSFDIKLQSVRSTPNVVNGMTVEYFVVEEGVYNVAQHGIKMEAVKINSTTTDYAGNFAGQLIQFDPANDMENHFILPNIFGQVMSYNDSKWSTFWSSEGPGQEHAPLYTIGKHVGEDADKTRSDETIGYVILESGQYLFEDIRFQVSPTGNDGYLGLESIRSSSNASTHDFANLPTMIGCIIQARGIADTENGYWTIRETTTGNVVTVRTIEDTLSDAEQTTENKGGSYIYFFRKPVSINDDVVTVNQNTAVDIQPLLNDETPYTPLVIDSYSMPTNGFLVLNGSIFTYLPYTGFTGADSFTCYINDGTEIHESQVNITVTPLVGETFSTSSVNVPITLSTGAPATYTSNLSITDSATILDVNVTMDINHTYDSDLIISLMHPDGTTIKLVQGQGGAFDNFKITTFDQSATTSINSAAAPFNGSFIPQESLDIMNGKLSNGIWQLVIDDVASYDGGMLNSWSLNITTAASHDIGVISTSTTIPANASTASSVITTSAAAANSGDVLTYQIISGNADGHFTIDESTGEITTSNSWNYNTKPSYSLIVEVTDQAARSKQATITVTVPTEDTNGNGIRDDWETIRTGSLLPVGKNAATDDADGDGVDNASEYISDTNPLDVNDYFKVTFADSSTNVNKLIAIPTKAARNYQVVWTADLTNWADETPIGGVITGNGNTQTVEDTIPPDDNKRFYRAHVTLP